MRFGILIPRVKTGDVGMLNGYDALRMATYGGAKALGMEDEIGTLEVGKKADIILVDLTTPWVNPIYKPNLITNLVYNANGSDVTDVFVDGNVVVRDKEIQTVDRRDVLKETQRRADRIWALASQTW
jgi:5-methylthioadenosine/S-adenosylhomocysteine deaminase